MPDTDTEWYPIDGSIDDLEAGGSMVITDGRGTFARFRAVTRPPFTRVDHTGEPAPGDLPEEIRLRVDPNGGVFILRPHSRAS